MPNVATRLCAASAFALSASVIAVAAPGAHTPNALPAAPAPLKIEVLGDSLAVGTGASDPANALAFRIYRSVAGRRPGSEITNHAIGGSRAEDVVRLQVAEIDPHADVVLLIVGGNDVVRQTKTARFAASEMTLLKSVRSRAPRAAIVAFGVPDVSRSPLFDDSKPKTEALSREDAQAVRMAASRYGAAYVDLFAFTHGHPVDPDFFSADDFHPSDAGYAELATFAEPVVDRAIGDR